MNNNIVRGHYLEIGDFVAVYGNHFSESGAIIEIEPYRYRLNNRAKSWVDHSSAIDIHIKKKDLKHLRDTMEIIDCDCNQKRD